MLTYKTRQIYIKKRKINIFLQNYFVLLTLNLRIKLFCSHIKALKYIINWTVGIIIGSYFLAIMVFSIPAVQRRANLRISEILTEQLGAKTEIGHTRFRIPNRLIIDEVKLYDRSDTLMLQANRLAAKIEILPLFNNKIYINNAQLIGAKVKLYKTTADAPHNFQFLIDKFASKDTTSKKNIDLKIGSIILRQCSIRYNVQDCPHSKGIFNPNHLDLQDINLTAQVKSLRPDSLNVNLSKFNLKESNGFEIKKFKVNVIAGAKEALIEELSLALPHSNVEIPSIHLAYKQCPISGAGKEWLAGTEYKGNIKLSLTPSDLSAFTPKVKHFNDGITLNTNFKGKGNELSFPDIHLSDPLEILQIQASATLQDIFGNIHANAELQYLKAKENLQQFITKNLEGREREISPILTRIGHIEARGNSYYTKNETKADLEIRTTPGTLNLKAILRESNDIEGEITTNNFQIHNLLKTNKKQNLEKLSLLANIKGKIKGKDNRPEWSVTGKIPEIIFKNYLYRGIDFNASNKGDNYNAQIAIADANGTINADINALLQNDHKTAKGNIEVVNLNPHQLNLTSKYPGETFSTKLTYDLTGYNLDNLKGMIEIEDLGVQSETKGNITTGPIRLYSHPEANEKDFNIESEFLKLQVEGEFQWKNLPRTFNQIAHQYLPSIFTKQPYETFHSDDITFTAQIKDTTLIERLAGIPLNIPQTANFDGRLDGSLGIITLNAQVPVLNYGSEKLQHIDIHMQSTAEDIRANVVMERLIKGTPIEMGLDARTKEDLLHLLLHWNNKKDSRAQVGEVDITSRFFKDLAEKQAISGKINESNLIINDSIWTIHPSEVTYHDDVIDVRDLRISKADKFLYIQGRVSKEEKDSIVADLHQINLAYIFDIINFHAVEFDGQATGRIYGSGLMQKPNMDAFLHVQNFTFNEGRMGDMDIHGNWGKRGNSIYLDANIQDPSANHQTTVRGTITPGRKAGNGLDLNIRTRRCNLYFLNKYTEEIFTNFQGRASGWAHIFGPFKGINIEGDLIADEAGMKVNALGVHYHLAGDSIVLRPNNIWIRNATVYDSQGGPGQTGHYANVNGHLMHTNLNNLKFDFNIDAHNLLGYDFREFGEESFYGTIFATGNVKLKGEPGDLSVDMTGKPEPGSLMVYNATSPETLTEAGFITYVSRANRTGADSLSTKATPLEEESETDIRLNFNINVTPDLTLRLLMDAQTGDYINLYGNSHILANYYNKGKFRMYGTYRVDHGVYKLSLQDVIHKDFQFQEGGTITFGGDAYQAALNLKASYMVPNVSLDDLSTTGLGFSNTRVDCIMNITGRPSAPMVTFDFDLPNANEDERQMIRSLLSTEEERNMQVIYLLGIGRFYNYGTQYMANSNQSTAAVNSLISSTLSSQFNQIMSNAMGTDKWSFGANLRTGETGWDQLDVEGILSGRLLNNRLLINGNIGYRESYYSTNNFIGDFDVQYILTPSGNLSLKAYNQTNDRYFIQSSLTTQGIGIQFKKDFNHWKELFKVSRTKKPRRKK